MPLGDFVPSEFEYDYPRWTAPAIGSTDTGKAWAWNDATGKYESTSFLLSSAVSVYGLTLASAADAAAARTALALGTAAVLNVGTSANNIVQLDGSARLPPVDGSQITGITVAAAGSTTQVIYNNAGVYAGHSGMTYSSANSRLTVAGGLVAPSMRPASDGTTALQLQNAAGSRLLFCDTTNGHLNVGITSPRSARITAQWGSGICDLLVDSTGRGGLLVFYGVNGQNLSFNAYGTGTNLISDIGVNYTIDSSSGVGQFVRIGAKKGPILRLSAEDGSISMLGEGGTGSDFRSPVHAGLIVSASGYVAIGQTAPTALLDLAASTTTRASLRIRSGTAPTSPNAGDIWFDGTHFYGYTGSATVQLDN